MLDDSSMMFPETVHSSGRVVHGKVIPGYLSSGKVVPKTKDTIKID